MKWLDKIFEREARYLAQHSSRRSILRKMGQVLIGGVVAFPVLPFDRTFSQAQAQNKKPINDETSCEYWRHCALDGFICSCCGGTVSSCPPGTEPSTITWVGTCRNPNDGKDYLISYNDCCGVTQCGRCVCNRNEGERPGYRMGVHNDINWCMANSNDVYHCTVAAVVGVGEKRAG